jgi:hypothetical protein
MDGIHLLLRGFNARLGFLLECMQYPDSIRQLHRIYTPRPLNRQLLGGDAQGGGDFVAAGLAQA